VLVTGASAGIGEATARAFAEAGATVVLGARRKEIIDSLAEELSKTHHHPALALQLDVTQEKSCEQFISESLKAFGKIDILINNAGLARGRDSVATLQETDMREMFETNVFGLLRLTRLALAEMLKTNSGHIINIGSVAGYGVYEGGSVYCATKFSVRVISETLRLELLGTPIRVSNISPGLVETEFSEVRFRGNSNKAKAVYAKTSPLTANDIAECIVFMANRPAHVDIDDLIIRPVDQAGFKIHRHDA
jgi:3-hydroxy acid dehydrogenase / malonic semialdehyde reductase